MRDPRIPLKTALLVGPLLAGILALHAWGDAAADRLGRQVDLWQYPQTSHPPFVLRVPRGVTEDWSAKILGEFPGECVKAYGALLDLHRPASPVQVDLVGPEPAARRLAGEQGEALKENESLYDPERRTILVKMGRTIEQLQVEAALRRGIARLLLQDSGSARWAPWLSEGLVGLLEGSKIADARAAGEDLPTLTQMLTAREADFRSHDGASYARAARLLVDYLLETSPTEFSDYCRAARAEGQVPLARFVDRFRDLIGEQAVWRSWIQAVPATTAPK